MRKRLKNKKRCCGMCKPYKRGWEIRWKPHELQAIKEFDKEKKTWGKLEQLQALDYKGETL